MNSHSSESELEESDNKPLMIPKNTKDLKACSSCGIIFTNGEWKEKRERCPNDCDANLTKSYEGVICLMKPLKSWVARRLPLGSNPIPGLYAFDVQAD